MIRRRRQSREIEFSFDSFLDVVANVVGIILRLILIAWVGARSYKVVVPSAATPPALTQEEIEELPDPQDPLSAELERQRREMADMQALLLEQLKDWQKLHQDSTLTAEELARLTTSTQEADAERNNLQKTAKKAQQSGRAAVLSLTEIRKRSEQVRKEIEALRKAPSKTKTLRYRTPVSHPLASEELLFECHGGRVVLIDIGGFLDEVRKTLRDRGGEALRSTGQYDGLTQAIGPFRLRYFLELDASTSKPECSWEVEPIAPQRGETLATALSAGSEFRRIIDNIEPRETAVTLCVYPDSFPLYRKLRDYMYERDIVVAGRALPEGTRIAASRHGTASRGQ